jgi:hypothetical protein
MDIIGLENKGEEQELLPMPTKALKELAAARKEKLAQVTDGNAISALFESGEELDGLAGLEKVA